MEHLLGSRTPVTTNECTRLELSHELFPIVGMAIQCQDDQVDDVRGKLRDPGLVIAFSTQNEAYIATDDAPGRP